MKKMNLTLGVMAVLLLAGAAAHAQVAPAATRSALPVNGNLHYDLRYTQSTEFSSGGQGDYQTSGVSGDVNYANGKQRLPFGLTYNGGYNWNLSGSSYNSGYYQNLSLSQGLVERHWNLQLNDGMSFSPQAPTTEYIGVSGITSPGQTVLTVNTRSIGNNASASFGRTLSRAMSLNLSGSWNILRYPDGKGQDTDGRSASGGISYRLDARNSLSGQYAYSYYSYGGQDLTISSNSAVMGWTRTWNRRLNTSVSAGPQWVGSSDSSIEPNSLHASVSASAGYKFNFGTTSLSYSHGAGGGGGYMLGAETDDFSASLSRAFGRNYSASVSGSYMRNSSLTLTGVNAGTKISGEYAGAQVSRQLGRHFSAYASYSASDQDTSGELSSNVLNYLTQSVNFGISYSPREIHFRR